MNASTFAFGSSAEAKLERRSSLRERMPNQISTWFSHEQCLGVYAKPMRGPGSLRNAFRLAFDFSTPDLPFSPGSPAIPHASSTYPSVRVGPTLGAMTCPHQTSRFAIRQSVPWRTYSNSRPYSGPRKPDHTVSY